MRSIIEKWIEGERSLSSFLFSFFSGFTRLASENENERDLWFISSQQNNKKFPWLRLHSNDVRFSLFFCLLSCFHSHARQLENLPDKRRILLPETIPTVCFRKHWSQAGMMKLCPSTKVDPKIIRIRNIIILQFVEHKHDVWWTISQFRPTFLVIAGKLSKEIPFFLDRERRDIGWGFSHIFTGSLEGFEDEFCYKDIGKSLHLEIFPHKSFP